MTVNKEKMALEAIKVSLNTKQGEYGIDLFISHHLEELSEDKWKLVLNKAKPLPKEVLEALIFKNSWGDDCIYDFTLPNEVTDYVVSVEFDEGGKLVEISMES